MKISLNWIKEFVDIPKNITPQKLAGLLTDHSVEVEEVIDQAKDFENIVVGQISKIEKHPNADKLQLVQVNTGEDKNIQVACGGTNLKQDMFVAMAKVGSRVKWHGLGDLITLEKTKIRGEYSYGMICSACEIGLGEYIEGDTTILEIENSSNKNIIGLPLAEHLNLDDVIIDIDNKTITHRPDLWGHFGIAREISAILKTKIKKQEKKNIQAEKKLDQILKVEIKNINLCSRYLSVVVDNIKIEASPKWLQNRLTAVGLRPINNIVDITNYVMLEIGQPMHAFDFDKLSSAKIIVRNAEKNEKIITLDKAERELDESMLVVADAKKAIAIAGIMGGNNSEVDKDSTKIVLESATFEATNSRITATKLGLRTEASARFEKNLDPNQAESAIKRALELIKEIIPTAKISSQIIDTQNFKLNQGPITLDPEYVQKKIGSMIEKSEIVQILESLGFEISSEKNLLKVTVPTWRATKDISSVDDLVEEIARIFGFNNIESVMPMVSMTPPKVNKKRELEKNCKKILNGLGLSEVINYSFISEDQVIKNGKKIEDHIKLQNSLSQDHTIIRSALTENLIKNIHSNLRYFDDFKIFEIGSVFKKGEGEYGSHPKTDSKLPIQETYLSGVVTSKTKKEDELFFSIKEVVENLLTKLQISKYKITPSEDSSSPSANIRFKKQQLGKIFTLNKKVQDNFDINKKTTSIFFELNLNQLYSISKDEIKLTQLNKFPNVEIDLAIVAPKKILWHNIHEEIKKSAGEKLKQIKLFDIYEGDNIENDKKSFAMHLSFAEESRTMEMKEVEKLREKIVKHLKQKFEANIR